MMETFHSKAAVSDFHGNSPVPLSSPLKDQTDPSPPHAIGAVGIYCYARRQHGLSVLLLHQSTDSTQHSTNTL